MKQDKSLFLTATLASILSLYSFDSRAESVTCSAGYMLPMGYKSCVPCDNTNLKKASTNNSDSLWCPGGKFTVSNKKHQGIQVCSKDTLADSKHQKCNKKKNVSARVLSLSKSKPISTGLLNANRLNNIGSAVSSVSSVSSAPARISCSAGKYLPANASSCRDCEDRYYCLGGTWSVASYNQGLISCPSGKVSSPSRTSCITPPTVPRTTPAKVSCSSGKYLPANASSCRDCEDRYYCLGGTWTVASYDQGLRSCPSGQISSSSRTYCITPAPSTYSCGAGTYLPKGQTSCKSCFDNYYCPGGEWAPDSGRDQGLFTCASGMIPTSNHSSCYDPDEGKVQCDAGTYLPMGKNNCETCLDGHYCTGGKWKPDSGINQGIVKCAEGMVANATRTSCKQADAMNCTAGEYIPAKSLKCKPCSGSTRYCPGVSGKYSDVDQGIYTCPDASKPNATKSACILTLDKDALQFGPGGAKASLSEQCWAKTESDKYYACMFGDKLNTSAFKRYYK